MRRLLACASVAFLFTAALGCHHTAGMCDCDHGCDPCGARAAHPVIKVEPAKPEPVKAMPKAADTGK